MAEKKKTFDISGAVHDGISSIIKEHPRFADFEKYFLKHLDRKKIQENVGILGKKIKSMRLSEEEAYQYIHRELADYISSGEAFDERGKNIILKNSLEGKAGGASFFKRIFSRPKFNGEKYLDETMEAFGDLYLLFKSGDYAERMPELNKSLETLYDLRFLNPAIDILKESGMIDSRKYNLLKNKVYSRTKEASKEVVSGIEKYAAPEKVAASVLAILGLYLVVSSSKITGAVIGISNNVLIGVIGGCLVFGAILIFNLSSRKIKN